MFLLLGDLYSIDVLSSSRQLLVSKSYSPLPIALYDNNVALVAGTIPEEGMALFRILDLQIF